MLVDLWDATNLVLAGHTAGNRLVLFLLVLRFSAIFALECHRDAISPQATLPLFIDSKGAQEGP